MLDITWLIPALPLFGFLVLLAVGPRLGEPAAGWLATAMVGGSFVASVVVFAGLVAGAPLRRAGEDDGADHRDHEQHRRDLEGEEVVG